MKLQGGTGGGGGGGVVDSVVAGTGIQVNATDPANPIVTNTGVLSVVAGTNVTVDDTNPQHPIVSATGGGIVDSVVAGAGIAVDDTDPTNPIVSIDLTGSLEQIELEAESGLASITNGANSISQVQSATNGQNDYIVNFLQGVQSFFEFKVLMPATYDGGTIQAQFFWRANSASLNSVVWGIEACGYAATQPFDTAYGAPIETTSANTGTLLENISALSAPCTPSGTPAASKRMKFRVYRLGSGADNLASTAELLTVRIVYARL
jgi:hypothetical protein